MKLIVIIFTFIIISLPFVGKGEQINGFANNNGVQIHYFGERLADDRPTLLFVPGLMMPGWIWQEQLDYFSRNYSAIAMDPRSQGESTQTSEGQYHEARASDIKAVIDQLQLKNVVLVGWSLALGEAISYLNQFGSENIKAVVLVDSWAGLDFDGPVLKMMLEFWGHFQKNRAMVNREFIAGIFRQPQQQEYIDRLNQAALRMPTTTMMCLVYDLIFSDKRPFLGKVDSPVLVVAVQAPWLDKLKEIHALTPNSEFILIENAGHAVFVDQPEAFNKAIEDFIQKH